MAVNVLDSQTGDLLVILSHSLCADGYCQFVFLFSQFEMLPALSLSALSPELPVHLLNKCQFLL